MAKPNKPISLVRDELVSDIIAAVNKSNFSVEVDGENKNVKEAINVIFKASESRLPK